tara:strand:- start:6293 stop:6421 length:129 start_codon:yes stop_codon:yes gene_type:complete
VGGAIFFVVAQRESYTWNLKRVYRIYKELELNLLIEPIKRLK